MCNWARITVEHAAVLKSLTDVAASVSNFCLNAMHQLLIHSDDSFPDPNGAFYLLSVPCFVLCSP